MLHDLHSYSDIDLAIRLLMHLSMSSPTYPRSGRGGDLQMLDDKFPTPEDSFELQIPY